MITEQERNERINFTRQTGQHLIEAMENQYRGHDFCSKFRPVISQKVEELCGKISRAQSERDIDAVAHEYANFVVKITSN